ncbi:hypothetical protein [Azohydromonas aeria]|uniref:hypothetical protein n=1 Tax=Azohydromonas aeria TaxID=2590212 RepID=UPI0012FBAE57|nr:hypothetical protein [Azohydromonas aeria]
MSNPSTTAARLASGLVRGSRACAALAAASIPDALVLGGSAALAHGAWLLLPAAGWLTGGALALVAGILAARRG